MLSLEHWTKLYNLPELQGFLGVANYLSEYVQKVRLHCYPFD